MSDLFQINLEEMQQGIKDNPNVENWDPSMVAALSLLNQIGIMERLELMVELQAMLADQSIDVAFDSPIRERLNQIMYHFKK